MRPYKADAYAPFKWRGIRAFGCGALGDMARYICDTPIQAFKLYTLTSAICEATDATEDMFPSKERVVIEFKGVRASGNKPVKLYWTDGGRMPTPQELNIRADYLLKQNTVAVIGSKGTLLIQPEAGTPCSSGTAIPSTTSSSPTCPSRTTGTSGSMPRSTATRPSRASGSRAACARPSAWAPWPRGSPTRCSPTTRRR